MWWGCKKKTCWIGLYFILLRAKSRGSNIVTSSSSSSSSLSQSCTSWSFFFCWGWPKTIFAPVTNSVAYKSITHKPKHTYKKPHTDDATYRQPHTHARAVAKDMDIQNLQHERRSTDLCSSSSSHAPSTGKKRYRTCMPMPWTRPRRNLRFRLHIL